MLSAKTFLPLSEMLRTITVHSENSVRFTPISAKKITQQLNEYRRANGEVSLKEMARIFGLGETNCSNYYYGRHHYHGWMYGAITNKCAEVHVLTSNNLYFY